MLRLDWIVRRALVSGGNRFVKLVNKSRQSHTHEATARIVKVPNTQGQASLVKSRILNGSERIALVFQVKDAATYTIGIKQILRKDSRNGIPQNNRVRLKAQLSLQCSSMHISLLY